MGDTLGACEGDDDTDHYSPAQVVQVLNPEEREMSALQSRMQQLSAELSTAHARVHSSEAALTTTLEEVRKLGGGRGRAIHLQLGGVPYPSFVRGT